MIDDTVIEQTSTRYTKKYQPTIRGLASLASKLASSELAIY